MIVREGQILNGTYRLVRLIGEGGMGRVYEATHARLAGRYAIKVLLHKLSSNAEVLRRFDREARITSSLQHPNIVQVIDFNTADDGTEFLVMEYLPGESVAARLYREGRQSLETVVDIVDQVTAGLAAAHAHGIVHRDLKPDNIFLVPVEGKATAWAKILDFGISKMRGAPAATGPVSAMLGTPLYMAPEQCQGRTGEVDAATDQFALAAITYEMLTGRSPFAGETVGEVLTHVIHDDPPVMGIDPNVEAVVRRGLSKVNANRFPSVVSFAEALRAAAALRPNDLGEGGTDAYTVGEMARAGRRGSSPRRNWGVLVPAAAVIALVSAFIVREARNGATEAEVRGRVAPSMANAAPRTIKAQVPRQPLPPPAAAAQPVASEWRNVAEPTPQLGRPATERAGESSVPRARLENARREDGGLVTSSTSRRNDPTTRREKSLALARAAAAAAESATATGARRDVPRKGRALDAAGNVASERLRPSPARLADEDATLPLDDAIDDRPAPPTMTPGVVERRTAN